MTETCLTAELNEGDTEAQLATSEGIKVGNTLFIGSEPIEVVVTKIKGDTVHFEAIQNLPTTLPADTLVQLASS